MLERKRKEGKAAGEGRGIKGEKSKGRNENGGGGCSRVGSTDRERKGGKWKEGAESMAENGKNVKADKYSVKKERKKKRVNK